MADYPLLRQLLVKLLRLDETEGQLPLAVIVNLHRTQLRLPLEKLIAQARIGVEGDPTKGIWRVRVIENANALIDARYPMLVAGRLFKQSSILAAATENSGVDLIALQDKLDLYRQTLFGQILYVAGNGWCASDPLVLLAAMVEKDEPVLKYFDQLEIELGLSYQVERLVLDTAGAK